MPPVRAYGPAAIIRMPLIADGLSPREVDLQICLHIYACMQLYWKDPEDKSIASTAENCIGIPQKVKVCLGAHVSIGCPGAQASRGPQ